MVRKYPHLFILRYRNIWKSVCLLMLIVPMSVENNCKRKILNNIWKKIVPSEQYLANIVKKKYSGTS